MYQPAQLVVPHRAEAVPSHRRGGTASRADGTGPGLRDTTTLGRGTVIPCGWYHESGGSLPHVLHIASMEAGDAPAEEDLRMHARFHVGSMGDKIREAIGNDRHNAPRLRGKGQADNRC